MLKTITRPHNIYFFLWILYKLQGTLYASGSLLSRSLLMIILLMSVYYFFRVNFTMQLPRFFKALNVFVAVLTMYGLVYMITPTPDVVFGHGGSPQKFEYLKNLYMSLLPIYPFYYFSKKKIIDEKWIRIMFFILLVITIGSFFRVQKASLQEAIARGSSREEFTNNVGYSFCALLPLLMLFRKNVWLQYILLFICVAFVVMGMKRGAIMISALCVVYFLYKNLANATKRQRRIILFFSVIVIVIGVDFIFDFIANSDYFQSRIEQSLEGDSSGRDMIYTNLLNHYFYKTTPLQFFLGGGADHTIAVIGNYAHNDWLELAINQGLLGIILYIWYFVALYQDTIRLKKQKNMDAMTMLIMIMGIIVVSSLISMSYADLQLSISLTVGYTLGQLNFQRKTATSRPIAYI